MSLPILFGIPYFFTEIAMLDEFNCLTMADWNDLTTETKRIWLSCVIPGLIPHIGAKIVFHNDVVKELEKRVHEGIVKNTPDELTDAERLVRKEQLGKLLSKINLLNRTDTKRPAK